MSVRVFSEAPSAPLTPEEAERAVAAALEFGGRPDLRVDVILVDDATLADRARAVAAERGEDAAAELRLYLVHGALHLCGYDDREPAERARMRAAEAAVLSRLDA